MKLSPLMALMLLSCGASPLANSTETEAIASVNSIRQSDLRKILISVENAPGGSCTTISLTTNDRELASAEKCHGWGAVGCDDLTLLYGRGVRIDWGVLAGPKEEQAHDLFQIASDALAKKEPGLEWLHFNIRPPDCREGRLAITIEGSVIARGATGPAEAGTAVLTFMPGGEVQTMIEVPRT